MSAADVLSGAARWAVDEGDCLSLLRSLPDGCVDAVVTDPPYATTGAASSFVSKDGGVPRETQFYEAWIREHLAAWRRVLRPTGAVWLTIDWRGAMALEHASARLGMRDPKIGVWVRGGLGMGYVLRNVYECFVVLPMEHFARKTANEPDVWEHSWSPANREHGHSAEKPIGLMTRALRLVTPPGGLVLDPFAGSGTTGVGCAREGLRFIGMERESAYVTIARARVAAAYEPAQAALSGVG